MLMKFNEKAISLACPIGEGAERSEAEGESKSIAIKYRSSQEQFSYALGHNANFVRKQDGTSVKFVRW